MKIAFVVSNLTYPPREGLHQQSILTAQMQLNRGDDLDLLGFCRNPQELDLKLMEAETGLRFVIPPIRSRLPDVLLGLKLRFLPHALKGHEVRRLQFQLAGDYDVIHLENAGACGLVLPKSSRRTLLAIIDPGTLRWKRIALASSSLKERFTAGLRFTLHSFLERSILRSRRFVHVVSPNDATYLERKYPDIRVSAVPVALPDEYLKSPRTPYNTGGARSALVSLDLRQAHLRSAFVWFVTCVFRPLISSGLTIRLIVLGRVDPDPELGRICSDLDIVFERWVPDFLTALSNCDILIAPDLTGTGLKNRVLQGMALGLPVVGTKIAFEGVSAVDGEHACIAEDAGKMKADLATLCENSDFASTLGEKAHDFVKSRFSTEALMRRWGELYAQIVEISK